MSNRTTRLRQPHLFVRRCVACGSPSRMRVAQRHIVCTHCGTDLLERPPRSYAEMEGIEEEFDSPMSIGSLQSRSTVPHRSTSRLVERWLLFVFLAMLMIFAIAALASAAMDPAGM